MTPKARDLLWKGIIEDLFADFLRFFYTRADEIFDMERGFGFLDKELGQLYPGDDIKDPKFVDKLVEVYKKDGGKEWILIHIEVQSYYDKLFSLRMFTYFYYVFSIGIIKKSPLLLFLVTTMQTIARINTSIIVWRLPILFNSKRIK